MLQKIAGNNFVHKLRAIFLFEADFNWWNKLIFARWTTKEVSGRDMVPEDLFAKKKSHALYAIVTKTYLTDFSKVLH